MVLVYIGVAETSYCGGKNTLLTYIDYIIYYIDLLTEIMSSVWGMYAVRNR